MPLVLEIEYLLGVSFAARGPDSAEPEWPPEPDRVFSALVAAWAARGGRDDEREALKWLERQPPPAIEASVAAARPAATAWVPPNDYMDRPYAAAFRTRAARRFPAALPADPCVRLVWDDTGGEAQDAPVEALDAVAREVSYVGHSASLTRCAVFRREAAAAGRPARRRIYDGRLAELEAAFEAKRRPRPGDAVPRPKAPPPVRRNLFGDRWLVFEIADGALDLRAAPIACKQLVAALMSGYARAGLGDAVPRWVSGHEPDGAPTREPHLAVVPLAKAGFEHADGGLLGFAIVPPAGVEDLLAEPDFRQALAAVAEVRDERSVIALTLGKAGVLQLAYTLESEKLSLRPARYLSAARRWASVTPLVLDRHLKAGGRNADVQAEMEALVADACERMVGARPLVAVGKHSAVTGAPSAGPSGGAPDWTGWRLPPNLRTRRLVHAVLEFPDPVDGPLLIGAGRFCGLGLCLPFGRESRR